MVVARIRLNRLDTDAYAQCFEAIFDQVKKDDPTFKVGDTLTGIIADWSDQQASCLDRAVGKSLAGEILKGCQVYVNTCSLHLSYIHDINVILIPCTGSFHSLSSACCQKGEPIKQRRKRSIHCYWPEDHKSRFGNRSDITVSGLEGREAHNRC